MCPLAELDRSYFYLPRRHRKLYVNFILQWIAFIFGRSEEKISRSFTCKINNSYFLLYLKKKKKKKNVQNAIRCLSYFMSQLSVIVYTNEFGQLCLCKM